MSVDLFDRCVPVQFLEPADYRRKLQNRLGSRFTFSFPAIEYTLKGFGLPEGLASAIAGWDTSASKGDLFDNSHQLSKLIGRRTTPLSDVVKDALKNL